MRRVEASGKGREMQQELFVAALIEKDLISPHQEESSRVWKEQPVPLLLQGLLKSQSLVSGGL